MNRFVPALLFITCLLTTVGLLTAQNMSVNNKVKPAFEKYFGLPRASLFIHLNKNAFVQGEHIWFKSYLFNRLKSTPFDEPVNLYVGIYDEKGNQLKKQLFISENGYAHGQIAIDSTLNEGMYYLKANTSWMQNFKEDDAFIQQFTVLGNEIEVESSFNEKNIDIQFLPEGGHWVTNVQSVLGIKAIDENGKSIPFLSGVVQNQFGDEITEFTTNQFGLAKITMLPEKQSTYRAFVKLADNSQKKIILPKPEETGLTLSVKPIADERFMILVGTNKETKKQIGIKPYSILIHRDGLLKNLEVVFDKNEQYVSHVLDIKELHNGINTITLIDNRGKALAERLVFNFNAIKKNKLYATIDTIKNDSLSIQIESNENALNTSLSISVLPMNTKGYQNDFNIESSFLVQPYLKGAVENLRYYFENRSKHKENEFDLLLLTQGWSKYEWDNIYDAPPKKKYDYRTGIDLIGKLNSDLPKGGQLLLYSSKNVKSKIVSIIDSTQTFKLDNYYLEEEDQLQFTILNRKGSLQSPKLYLRVDAGVVEDKIHDLYGQGFDNLIAPKFNTNGIEDFILPSNAIALDEVIVRENKYSGKNTSPIIPEYKIKKMTKNEKRLYPNLIDLIRSSGFNVWEMPNTGYDRVRITTKRPLVFSLVQPSPILYIDDIRYADFNILLDFKSTKIESYFIDRSGNGEAGGAGGVIRVYTHKEGDSARQDDHSNSQKAKFYTYSVSGGFTTPKQYYMPKYKSITNEAFQNFGSIHWEPNLSLDATGKGAFRIYDTGVEEVLLFIEGMNSNGELYSTRQILRVPSNQ